MNASIICVGNEVLTGDTVNTDAAFLAKALTELNFKVKLQAVVADNACDIASVTAWANTVSDVIIYTGGLGPTSDDITVEAVCTALGEEIVFDEANREKIEKYFACIGAVMNKTNLKQCYRPKNGVSLPNENGTAPGAFLTRGNKCYAFLPGPPHELKTMFTRYLSPILCALPRGSFAQRFYMLSGVGEGAIEANMRLLNIEDTSYNINSYLSESGVCLKAVAEGENSESILNEKETKLLPAIEPFLYASNEAKEEIWETCVRLLCEKNISFTFAESCTGGLLAKLATETPGVSACFPGSFVTYSDEEKIQLVGVKKADIEKYGAVSASVAVAMAEGAKKAFNTLLSASVTGYAGPDGEEVGLVYHAVSYNGKTFVWGTRYKGSREKIRSRAAAAIFKQIFDLISQ